VALVLDGEMMSEQPEQRIAEKAGKLQALHEKRALAELAAADRLAPGSDIVPWSGALLADAAVVKGLPGPAEAAGGVAMSGTDGAAALKALEALGHSPDAVFFTLSRPSSEIDAAARAARLRMQIEAVDPSVVVAVDAEAAADLALAFDAQMLEWGVAVRAHGRRLVAVDGLERSLSDDEAKRQVWAQLKAARADGPVY
jgi:hypothetical protein